MKTNVKPEAKHTPTPWHYDGEFIATGEERFGSPAVREQIAEVKDGPNWEANAAFIVRAVNEYEKLMRIVKELQKYKDAGEEYIRFEALMTDTPEADDTTFGELVDDIEAAEEK